MSTAFPEPEDEEPQVPDAIDVPPPGVRNSDPATSRAADDIVRARSGTQRLEQLKAFHRAGDDGYTADEVGAVTGTMRSCYWKRTSELRKGNLIEDTGTTRAGESNSQQIVSRITEAGRLALLRRRLIKGDEG